MPLIYVGHQHHRGDGPGQTLERNLARIDGLAVGYRLDGQVTFLHPHALTLASQAVDEDYDGFWLHVGARASAAEISDFWSWLSPLRAGHIRVRGRSDGGQITFTAQLTEPQPLGVDEPVLDPMRSRLLEPRWHVALAASHRGGWSAAEASHRAATRVSAAYAALRRHLVPTLPPYAQWVADVTADHAFDADLVAVLEGMGEEYAASRPADPAVPADMQVGAGIAVSASAIDRCPFNLLVHCPGANQSFRRALLDVWLALLDSVEAVEIRAAGRLDAVMGVLDRLDVERRVDGGESVYGVTTLGCARPLGLEVIRSLLAHETLTKWRCGWGLRWSHIEWEPPSTPADPWALPLEDAPLKLDGFYFVRADERDTHDQLLVRASLDDPDSPCFRAIQRVLAAGLGSALLNKSGWSFEGPPEESVVGQRYGALRSRLEATHTLVRGLPDLPPRPPGHGTNGPLGWVRRLISGRDPRLQSRFGRLAQAALDTVVTGFARHRMGHPTDAYFADFVRRSRWSCHYVQFVRKHTVPGYRVRIGVSLHLASLEDLEPATHCTSHGLVVRLESLFTDADVLEWSFLSETQARAALAETADLLRARVVPFFERCDQVIAEFRRAMQGRSLPSTEIGLEPFASDPPAGLGLGNPGSDNG